MKDEKRLPVSKFYLSVADIQVTLEEMWLILFEVSAAEATG
jgi:hypothetical protein